MPEINDLQKNIALAVKILAMLDEADCTEGEASHVLSTATAMLPLAVENCFLEGSSIKAVLASLGQSEADEGGR